MSMLTSYALDHGATHGILAATAQGRMLVRVARVGRHARDALADGHLIDDCRTAAHLVPRVGSMPKWARAAESSTTYGGVHWYDSCSQLAHDGTNTTAAAKIGRGIGETFTAGLPTLASTS